MSAIVRPGCIQAEQVIMGALEITQTTPCDVLVAWPMRFSFDLP